MTKSNKIWFYHAGINLSKKVYDRYFYEVRLKDFTYSYDSFQNQSNRLLSWLRKNRIPNSEWTIVGRKYELEF